MNSSRRRILGGLASGAGLGLLGLTKKSAAGEKPPSRRVCFVVAEGGLRTTMGFNPSARFDLNPWGVLDAGGVRLGNAFFIPDAAPGFAAVTYEAPSWPEGGVPDIAAIASTWSFIGAADHAPNQYRAGDHYYDGFYMGRGWAIGDAPGLATLCNRYLTTADTPLPACLVGLPVAVGGPLAYASGSWKQHVPIGLDAYYMPGASVGKPTGLGSVIEDLLDVRMRDRRRALTRTALETYGATKRAMRTYGPKLTDPALNMITADPGTSFGGVSNLMLMDAFGGPAESEGYNFATAARLLQMGSPFVGVLFGGGGFDTHSGERDSVTYLYPRLARMLAGLHFSLSRIEDLGNPGKSLLDTTLVVVASEFGRMTGAAGGYEERDGTDHGGEDPAWRTQAHVLFGGGNQAGMLAPTDDDNVPLDRALPTQELLASIASWVGVPKDLVEGLWPIGTAYRPNETKGAVDALLG